MSTDSPSPAQATLVDIIPEGFANPDTAEAKGKLWTPRDEMLAAAAASGQPIEEDGFSFSHQSIDGGMPLQSMKVSDQQRGEARELAQKLLDTGKYPNDTVGSLVMKILINTQKKVAEEEAMNSNLDEIPPLGESPDVAAPEPRAKAKIAKPPGQRSTVKVKRTPASLRLAEVFGTPQAEEEESFRAPGSQPVDLSWLGIEGLAPVVDDSKYVTVVIEYTGTNGAPEKAQIDIDWLEITPKDDLTQVDCIIDKRKSTLDSSGFPEIPSQQMLLRTMDHSNGATQVIPVFQVLHEVHFGIFQILSFFAGKSDA